ncbi:MAG: helix-turn-helix transcriptional regulator [Acidobacteriota bacterium]
MAAESLSGRILRHIRVQMAIKNWKQIDLAARMGKKGAWVSKIMAGRIKLRVDDVSEFARALEVSEDTLLRGEGKRG